jgi:hypoxanthine phosphoribosyltransferase
MDLVTDLAADQPSTCARAYLIALVGGSSSHLSSRLFLRRKQWYRRFMSEAIVRPMLSAEQIAERVRALGEQISREYADRRLVLVCVLKGSFVFTADLARHITIPLRVEFLGVRSYGEGTSSSGIVQITQDLSRSIEGEDILLVEDIVDTGLTIAAEVPIHYLGFTIEDKFVVGYGLDWAERYRNVPFIGVVEAS